MHKSISFLFVVLFIFAAFVPTAAAQGDYDEAVRACTVVELAAIAPPVTEFFAEFSGITSGVTEDNAIERVWALDALYVEFWTEIQPEFPDCAFALRTERFLARVLGETYIGLVWISVGSAQMASTHAPLMEEVIAELDAFVEHALSISERLP